VNYYIGISSYRQLSLDTLPEEHSVDKEKRVTIYTTLKYEFISTFLCRTISEKSRMNGDNNNDMLVRYGRSTGRRHHRIVLFARIRAYGTAVSRKDHCSRSQRSTVARNGSVAVLVSAEEEAGQAIVSI
jgi:hypothetical protein